MSQVKIDAKALRYLSEQAAIVGTLDKWAVIALEWVDKAEAEITLLRAQLNKQNQED
jgi:hypothetical protein